VGASEGDTELLAASTAATPLLLLLLLLPVAPASCRRNSLFWKPLVAKVQQEE